MLKEFNYQGDIKEFNLKDGCVEAQYYGWDNKTFKLNLKLSQTYFIYFDLDQREIIRSKSPIAGKVYRLFPVAEDTFNLVDEQVVLDRVDLRKIKEMK